jgi:CHASE3 domain sensor protein
MLIVRGKSDALHEIMESDDGRKLITSAGFIVQDLSSQWFYRGDDEIQALTQMFSQVGSELGLM